MQKAAHAISSSKLNTRYIQPHCQLAEHIVSHKISPEMYTKIYDYWYNQTSVRSYLRTQYYETDRVYQVMKNKFTKKVEYTISFRNDYMIIDNCCKDGLEYVGENRFNLKESTFPMMKRYDQERQSVVHVFDTLTHYMELELLVKGIEKYEDRLELISISSRNPDNEAFISLSFRLYLKPGIGKDEIYDILELLKSFTSN